MQEPQPLFSVELLPADAGGRVINISVRDPVSGDEVDRRYAIGNNSHSDYCDMFNLIARDFGTRVPQGRGPASHGPLPESWEPLLTRNLTPDILYGYGDPAVVRTEDGYFLFVTSNDAPNAFPILHSHDLREWRPKGFAFPEHVLPQWAAQGRGIADFWAPELHHVGGSYLLCFSAREKGGGLAIGLARSSRPDGPFETSSEPLLSGGVIDSHIFVDQDGSTYLIWKEDRNGIWPSRLAGLLGRRPDLIGALFPRKGDRLTAALAAGCWGPAQNLSAMERFFLFQPLIEATVDRFAEVQQALRTHAGDEAGGVIDAMRTPVFIQRLDAERLRLFGERRTILVNDLPWEGHLIEGPWLSRHGDRYYLLYSGNDFSTADYGIGVAVADGIFGPYRKQPDPVLKSNTSWVGPGHPSIATGPDDIPRLFFHAFRPEALGYNVFRALLCARMEFLPDTIRLLPRV